MEWLDFEFYDLVSYWDTPGDDNNSNIGQFLGIAHHFGTKLCYWILKSNGQVLVSTTVQRVTRDDLATDETKQEVTEFDTHVNERLLDDKFIDHPIAGDVLTHDIFHVPDDENDATA